MNREEYDVRLSDRVCKYQVVARNRETGRDETQCFM